MAEQKDPAETVDPVVDRADPPEAGVTESAPGPDASSSADDGSADAGAVNADGSAGAANADGNADAGAVQAADAPAAS
ncbi:hypothetical protein JNW91_11125, partial [Micromonospora sp. STR1_7]